MPGRASTITPTTIYSDDATEVPPLNYSYHDDENEEEQKQPKEGKLIDYENEQDEEEEFSNQVQNPGDKLRELLNQMKYAVEITKPTTISIHGTNHSINKKEWKKNSYDEDLNEIVETSSPIRSNKFINEENSNDDDDIHNFDIEEEEESPPTPPPRINNPYSSRRNDKRNSPNFNQPGRLTSRAAVLLNSTSRSSSSTSSSIELSKTDKTSPPSKLETFLASSNSSLPPQLGESSTSNSVKLRSSLERRNSGSSTSSIRSRKGKEREEIHRLPTPLQPTSTEETSERLLHSDSRRRYRNTPPPEDQSYTRRNKGLATPRRISVDIAPEDIHSFARNAVDLEVRGEVELDLDEGLSNVGWEESSQSVIEELEEIPSVQNSRRNILADESNGRRDRSSIAIPRQSNSIGRSPLNQNSHIRVNSAESPPLPALPEPEISENDISEIDTYSSRRAALFRSTSKSPSTSQSRSSVKNQSHTSSTFYGTPTEFPSKSHLSKRESIGKEEQKVESSPERGEPLPKRTLNRSSRSPELESKDTSSTRSTRNALRQSYSAYHSVEDIPIPPQEPIQVNFLKPTSYSLLKSSPTPPISNISPSPRKFAAPNNTSSTPIKSNNPNLSTLPTPKPPGAWQSTPNKSRVRFNPSPLGKVSPTTGNASHNSSQNSEGVSIHRLKVSPRRSPKSKAINEVSHEEVGNGSFLGKLKESISSPLKRSLPKIPPKSTTFSLHTPSIEKAKSTTLATEQALIITQKQWLEALQTLSNHSSSIEVGNVVRKSWGWGTWFLWGLIEIIVLWSVFRMTIDYATSLNQISNSDPFHPLSLPFNSNNNILKFRNNNKNNQNNLINLNLPISNSYSSSFQNLIEIKNNNNNNVNFFDLIENLGLIWNKFENSKFKIEFGNGNGNGLDGVPS
ncbi:uncharacterized protein I206_103827 [Kwoniella pini CBS 10737]|uniref:Uncharacterized protein n=1 Tax=Kwoniella pini CBS 10737 TaxID=1296096 RepID=A0A1B9HSP7_9TREE|nr:uncharacterized protein I206_07780 [Kwoniella pini CBS 10737]OCF46299.1 hypothetical protein I206_07780 [Kwoniella pini CBS 10737]